MKIKGYKMFLESQTEESVRDICEKYDIKNWSIDSEGLVDVNGDVDLSHQQLTKLPLKFGKVTGFFDCYKNKLTSLEGGPKEVGGYYFDCSKNGLTSLEGSPKEVDGHFNCSDNGLNSLEGSPEKVGRDFDCSENQLTSLIGGPQVVLGKRNYANNQITSFEGFPDDYEGLVYFDNNPVQKILDQFTKELWVKAIHLINDYDAIWNGEVVEERLEMVKEKLGLEYPW
jgi:hypothetical protein